MEYDAGKGAWLPLVRRAHNAPFLYSSHYAGRRRLDEAAASGVLRVRSRRRGQSRHFSVLCLIPSGELPQAPAAPVAARANKKRKEPDYTSATPVGEGHSIKRGKQDKKDKPATERKSKNTAIYVTGLPLDTEFDEVVTCFSKFGVLEEADDGEPKVKMYARDDGSFSGEALVVYFKEDSVILALNILDESELRLGDPNSVMHLAKADFSHKNTDAKTGESQPRKTVDKKKASRRIGKMQQCVTCSLSEIG